MQSTSPLDAVLAALADPTRRAIVERLIREGPRTAGDLAAPFVLSKPAISRHLKVLEAAGLIERRVERQWRVFHVRPEAVGDVEAWAVAQRRFWSLALDRLEAHLAATTPQEEKQ